MASSGSACASKNLRLSHILNAIGIDVAVGQGSILFTISKFNTEEEINYVLEEFPNIVKRLRDMSPLYSYFLKTGSRKVSGLESYFDDHHDGHCSIEKKID